MSPMTFWLLIISIRLAQIPNFTVYKFQSFLEVFCKFLGGISSVVTLVFQFLLILCVPVTSTSQQSICENCPLSEPALMHKKITQLRL